LIVLIMYWSYVMCYWIEE